MVLLRFILVKLLAVVLLPLVMLAGCAPVEPAAPRFTFTDALGRMVTLERPVERVLTLAPSLTETVFAAGAGHKLVGAGTPDNYPPAVDTLPRFGVLPVDFEKIAALAPGVVLATDQVNTTQAVETLETLGIPTLFLPSGGLGDVIDNIRTLGALLGTTAAAEAAADSLEQEIAALRAATKALAEKPLVLFLIGDETLYAFGQGSYIHDIIALAGGRSATAEFETRAPVLSEEFVLTARPDIIVGAFGEDYDAQQLLALHPTWRDLPAVRAGRVYSLDPDLFLRPGPRLVEGARRLAQLLPERKRAGGQERR